MVKHAGYERQDGFGWTNGVALYFLSLYQQHCSYVKYQQWTVSDDSDYRHGSGPQHHLSSLPLIVRRCSRSPSHVSAVSPNTSNTR
mmetsp:Transcript_22177/g.48181  ORF Transcript_22177/g.48181 Transcript_22177/m.48181 type:complete len:86 (+) Transcript_22177:309-566(+)